MSEDIRNVWIHGTFFILEGSLARKEFLKLSEMKGKAALNNSYKWGFSIQAFSDIRLRNATSFSCALGFETHLLYAKMTTAVKNVPVTLSAILSAVCMFFHTAGSFCQMENIFWGDSTFGIPFSP